MMFYTETVFARIHYLGFKEIPIWFDKLTINMEYISIAHIFGLVKGFRKICANISQLFEF